MGKDLHSIGFGLHQTCLFAYSNVPVLTLLEALYAALENFPKGIYLISIQQLLDFQLDSEGFKGG